MSEGKALAIIPRSIDEVMSLATELSKATTIAAELRDKPANVLAAIMAGQELGFSPMAALRSVHIIKGVPKLSADAMAAAVLASGLAEYFEPSAVSHDSVTYVTKRKGSTREQSCTWTSADAKRAGLVTENHQRYSRQMLSARAKSELARSVYPDVCAGIYTDEEMVERAETDAVDAEFVESPLGPTLADRCKDAATIDDLKALVPELNQAKKNSPERAAAMAAYKERLASLEKAPTAEVEVAA